MMGMRQQNIDQYVILITYYNILNGKNMKYMHIVEIYPNYYLLFSLN